MSLAKHLNLLTTDPNLENLLLVASSLLHNKSKICGNMREKKAEKKKLEVS